jgi:hypothetical protein
MYGGAITLQGVTNIDVAQVCVCSDDHDCIFPSLTERGDFALHAAMRQRPKALARYLPLTVFARPGPPRELPSLTEMTPTTFTRHIYA